MVNSKKMIPGIGGEKYRKYEERTGEEAVVYFTRDLSPEGLLKIYDKVSGGITGKTAVKLHTGEKNGPDIIPAQWVKRLMEERITDGTIVETNTYYEGDRYTTSQHRETLKVNGWTFALVDIMDEEGTVLLPVKGGKWFTEMSVGSHLTSYNSLVTLTHFIGHTQGGLGGSNKNLGIGCAAAPVVTPNVGILASEDILAADQASVDLIYAMKPQEHHDLVERMESRHSMRQLTYMKELHMGHDRYVFWMLTIRMNRLPVQML